MRNAECGIGNGRRGKESEDARIGPVFAKRRKCGGEVVVEPPTPRRGTATGAGGRIRRLKWRGWRV
jgi:hypothetical protein